MSGQDTAVQEYECPECGADVRPESQFCYNCGGTVAVEHTASENGSKPTSTLENYKATTPAPGLRSAREIRRERTFDRKPREVVWEPVRDGGREGALLIITGLVVLFTIVVIFLAFYLH